MTGEASERDPQTYAIIGAAMEMRSSIVVELKAIEKLTELEDAQVLHYLKATAKRFIDSHLR